MAEPRSANEFVAHVRKLVKQGDHKISELISDGRVMLTLRMGDKTLRVTVEGFHNRDPNAPAPGANIGNSGGPGIVRGETSQNSFAHEFKMRRKTGTVVVVAKHVAEAFNKAIGGEGNSKTAATVAARFMRLKSARSV